MEKISGAYIIKVIEVIAASTALFIAIVYFSGFVIFTTFLSELFQIPIVSGLLFPPSLILSLGFIFIVSLLVLLPFFIILSLDKFIGSWEYIGYFLIVNFIWKVSFSFTLLKWVIPSWITTLLLLFLVTLFIPLKVRLQLSYEKKGRLYRLINSLEWLVQGYPRVFFFIVFPLLVIPFSLFLEKTNAKSHELQNLNILFMYLIFYWEYLFALFGAIKISIYIIKKARKIKSNIFTTSFTIFFLIVIYFLYLYSLSFIVGRSIAKNYQSKEIGIFPKVELTKSKITEKIIESSQEANFLTKDENYVYIFTLKPKEVIFIPKNEIKQLRLK